MCTNAKWMNDFDSSGCSALAQQLCKYICHLWTDSLNRKRFVPLGAPSIFANPYWKRWAYFERNRIHKKYNECWDYFSSKFQVNFVLDRSIQFEMCPNSDMCAFNKIDLKLQFQHSFLADCNVFIYEKLACDRLVKAFESAHIVTTRGRNRLYLYQLINKPILDSHKCGYYQVLNYFMSDYNIKSLHWFDINVAKIPKTAFHEFECMTEAVRDSMTGCICHRTS